MDWDRFEQHKRYSSTEFFREQAKDKQVWEIPFLRDPFHEDNDTSEDEESSEEDDPEWAHLKLEEKNLHQYFRSELQKKFDPSTPKKELKRLVRGGGLTYFIKKEQEALRSTPAKVDYLNPVDELHLNNCEFARPGATCKFYEPRKASQKKDAEDHDSSDESDEDFTWYNAEEHEKDTYFAFINI